MKLAIFGNNDGPLRLLQSLQKAGSTLPELVVLQKEVNPELRKRYKDLLGYTPKLAADEISLLELLREADPDILINCFGNFIFRETLDQFKVLNVHLSPLPAYRGRHPIHHALINGEKYCGISIHRMEKRVDAGPVYWQRLVEVEGYPSVNEMREMLMLKLEDDFAGFHQKLRNDDHVPIPSNGFKESYFKPMTPEDSELSNWGDPRHIVQKVNALRDGNFPAFINLPEKIVFNKAWLNRQPREVKSKDYIFSYHYGDQIKLELAGPQPFPPHLKEKIDNARTLS